MAYGISYGQSIGSMLRGLNGLSMDDLDEICVEGDCDAGRRDIKQMRAVFEQLSKSNSSIASDFAARVTAIGESFDSVINKFTTRFIPFAAGCCEARDIGRQAKDLSNQMLRAANQGGLPDVKPPSGFLESILKTVAIVGGIGVGIVFLPKLLAAGRESASEIKKIKQQSKGLSGTPEHHRSAAIVLKSEVRRLSRNLVASSRRNCSFASYNARRLIEAHTAMEVHRREGNGKRSPKITRSVNAALTLWRINCGLP